MLRIVLLFFLVAVVLGGVLNKEVSFSIAKLDERILGGKEVIIQDYPYQLSLLIFGNHICGASVISSNVAVTSALCIDGLSEDAVSVRVSSSFHESGGQVIKVKNIYSHPRYNNLISDYDIAVLILNQGIRFAKPLDLPSQNENIPGGTDAIISGWGALSDGGRMFKQLRVVQVPIVTSADCKRAYGSLFITERMICAANQSGNKGSCVGDLGGPLVADGKLIGIASWQHGCGYPNYPDGYTNVAKVRSFIKDVSGV